MGFGACVAVRSTRAVQKVALSGILPLGHAPEPDVRDLLHRIASRPAQDV